MELVQQTGKKTRTFLLTDGGIRITTYTHKHLPSEENFAFENIKRDRLFRVQKFYPYLTTGIIALAFYGFILYESLQDNSPLYIYNSAWALAGIVFITLFFIHRPKVYLIATTTGTYIPFPICGESEAVQTFIAKVFEHRDAYLKVKYGHPNPHLSYDAQFSNFNILQREDIITLEEYEEKIALLNHMFEKSVPSQVIYRYSEN